MVPGQNVSKRGEDVAENENVLLSGTILQPPDVGILAAIGSLRIEVIRKPIVAILSTGNELVEPGMKLGESKTADINRYALSAAVLDAGGESLDFGIARDEEDEIKYRISKGLVVADIVLVSGGTSVGEEDLIPELIDNLGSPGLIVHGISIRPGKPTALAAIGKKPIILLPGNPVAALIAFDVFVRPIISRMFGISSGRERGELLKAKITRRVPSNPGIRDFVRVKVEKRGVEYFADPIRAKGAGIISSMVRANGMVIIPEEKEGIEEGEEVEVTLLRPLKD